MTMPDERYRAVNYTEKFLVRLAGGEYPRVPKAVREEARMLLRHYPSQYYMDQVSEQMPGIFARELDPLHKFVARGGGPTASDDTESALSSAG